MRGTSLFRLDAVERYCGTLYEAAERTVEQLFRITAGVAIVSGGYGVVSAREQVGWYERRFDKAMWPDDLVARCLSAYAKAIGARTAVGLFGATTSYAKAFRRAKWPADIQNAWLVSPELRGGGGWSFGQGPTRHWRSTRCDWIDRNADCGLEE